MNAQAILTKIEEDARQSAAELLTDANGRAEEIKTASVGLSIYLNEQIGMVWGEMMAAGAVIAFPVLFVYFFFQKKLIGGITDGAVKG